MTQNKRKLDQTHLEVDDGKLSTWGKKAIKLQKDVGLLDKGGDSDAGSGKAGSAAQVGSACSGHAGLTAKGGGADAGSGKAGLTAQGGCARQAPTKPSQSDIDAGVAIPVKEYMKALIPYVQTQLTAFLKQKDSRPGGALAEAPPFQISQGAQKAFKNFREP